MLTDRRGDLQDQSVGKGGPKVTRTKMLAFWNRVGAVLLLVYSLTLVYLFIGIGLYGHAHVSEPCVWWWAVELFIFVCSAALALWLLLRKKA